MGTISFGFTLPQRGVFFGATTWKELLELAAATDNNPTFDSLWVGDSLLAKPRPESLTLLGAIAGITKRVRLGVGCMASFPIRDPIVFAYQWANLDQISNGRMQLAACTGIVPDLSAHEGSQWGVKDADRGPRLVENIKICRQLWSGEKVTFEGKFTSFHDVSVIPRPVQQPCPMWIASNPRPTEMKALRRVARFADGWMTVGLFPQMFAANWGRVCEYLKEEGKDPAKFPNMAYHNINVGTDRAAALEESRRFLEEYYGPVFTPPMVEAWTAAGPPEACAAHLRDLIGQGAKSITLRVTGWKQREQYQRVVEEVLPMVRG